METMKDICQSCAMPLTNEQKGTNEDGSSSEDYCKYCFQGGEYTASEMTMDQMIDVSAPFMIEEGTLSLSEAKSMLAKILPTLKRWRE